MTTIASIASHLKPQPRRRHSKQAVKLTPRLAAWSGCLIATTWLSTEYSLNADTSWLTVLIASVTSAGIMLLALTSRRPRRRRSSPSSKGRSGRGGSSRGGSSRGGSSRGGAGQQLPAGGVSAWVAPRPAPPAPTHAEQVEAARRVLAEDAWAELAEGEPANGYHVAPRVTVEQHRQQVRDSLR